VFQYSFVFSGNTDIAINTDKYRMIIIYYFMHCVPAVAQVFIFYWYSSQYSGHVENKTAEGSVGPHCAQGSRGTSSTGVSCHKLFLFQHEVLLSRIGCKVVLAVHETPAGVQ